jgi:aryl-alcohol dehydrogenase-like predicted oxidoreductase
LVKAEYATYRLNGRDTITRAHKGNQFDLQIEYRAQSLPEQTIFPILRNSIGDGVRCAFARMLSGSKPTGPDFRARLPRFSGDNYEKNQKLVSALQQLAQELAATPSQVAIAGCWPGQRSSR